MSLSVKTLVRCYFGLAVIDSCCPLLASWCAARAVPLRVRYLNASIGWVHSLMDGDKIDGGWSKALGSALSLHCPCSKLGEQAPVKCRVHVCGFWLLLLDFSQIFIEGSAVDSGKPSFHRYWRLGKCKNQHGNCLLPFWLDSEQIAPKGNFSAPYLSACCLFLLPSAVLCPWHPECMTQFLFYHCFRLSWNPADDSSWHFWNPAFPFHL